MNTCNYCHKDDIDLVIDFPYGCACEKCSKWINTVIKLVTSDKEKCPSCKRKKYPITQDAGEYLNFVCPTCSTVLFQWTKNAETQVIDKFVEDPSDAKEPLPENPIYTPPPVRCPKCSSTQITTGSRGYSLAWGFIGANKTVNRCAKCGHSWEPKR